MDMDTYEIRRLNLDVLKAELRSYRAIGEAMRRSKMKVDPKAAEKDYANVLSQINGGKHMGHQFARDLEVAMGKAKGWMDTPQFKAVDEAMEAKEAGQLAMNMKPEDREAWMKHGRLLAQQNPDLSEANPFGDIPKGGVRKGPRRVRAPKKPRRSGGTQ